MSRDRWREAADLGARGRYADSWAILDDLADASPPWPSLAASMRASHLRQIGQVPSARAHDVRALRLAHDAESRCEAQIGLAADDIASGNAIDASAMLTPAGVDAASLWRTSTRWNWVSAELSLALGRPAEALDTALQALAACEDHSDRHVAKSLIIADVARGATGSRDVGDGLLRASDLARREGLVTLQWPLALAARDLTDGGSASLPLVEEGTRLWDEGRAAVLVIAEGLPDELRDDWRRGPAAARLLGGGE